MTLHATGALSEAAQVCDELCNDYPRDAELVHLLATVRKDQGRFDEARHLLQTVIELEPKNAAAHFHLASVEHARDRLAAAAACYQRAIELKPQMTAAYVNCGNVLRQLGALTEAVAHFRQAAALEPDNVEALYGLGRALSQAGDAAGAVTCLARAVKLRPGFSDLRYAHGLALLQAGELARGWEEYEHRFDQRGSPPLRRRFDSPEWRGESLQDRVILVWGEQGVGDELIFASLLPELAERARLCVFECSAKLVPLLSLSLPGVQVIARTDPLHEAASRADVQIAAGSVARWLRPDIASFPARKSFLRAEQERIEYWRARLDQDGHGLRVGISWRSTNLTGERALYCPSIEDLEPLFALNGVTFVNLQPGDTFEELRGARERSSARILAFSEVDLFDDLLEAAALTSAMDLVISAPTTVSVLAASLGVPTWQLTYAAYWESHGTDHFPWHPALRSFARFPPQRWRELTQRVAQELQAVIARSAVASRDAHL